MRVLMSIQFWDRKAICATVAGANREQELSVSFFWKHSFTRDRSCWCSHIRPYLGLHILGKVDALTACNSNYTTIDRLSARKKARTFYICNRTAPLWTLQCSSTWLQLSWHRNVWFFYGTWTINVLITLKIAYNREKKYTKYRKWPVFHSCTDTITIIFKYKIFFISSCW